MFWDVISDLPLIHDDLRVVVMLLYLVCWYYHGERGPARSPRRLSAFALRCHRMPVGVPATELRSPIFTGSAPRARSIDRGARASVRERPARALPVVE